MFFKWDVIERYFPAIVRGMVVTIEVAVAVVITGIAVGLIAWRSCAHFACASSMR